MTEDQAYVLVLLIESVAKYSGREAAIDVTRLVLCLISKDESMPPSAIAFIDGVIRRTHTDSSED
jgi:hypothetical protein